MLLRKANANAMASSSSRAVGLVDLTITANQQIFVASKTASFYGRGNDNWSQHYFISGLR
jgi:hypothetical protein